MLWDILILVKIGLVNITLLKLILLKQEVNKEMYREIYLTDRQEI